MEYVRGGGRLVFLSPPPHLDVDRRECRALTEGLGLSRGATVDRAAEVDVCGVWRTVRLMEEYGGPGAEPVDPDEGRPIQ